MEMSVSAAVAALAHNARGDLLFAHAGCVAVETLRRFGGYGEASRGLAEAAGGDVPLAERDVETGDCGEVADAALVPGAVYAVEIGLADLAFAERPFERCTQGILAV